MEAKPLTDEEIKLVETMLASGWESISAETSIGLLATIAARDAEILHFVKEITDLKDYIKDLEFSIRTGMEKYP